MQTTTGFAGLALDPSRGALMTALTDTPNFRERIDQGGAVGYVIIVLGILALIIGLIRWVAVTIAGRRVSAQQRSDQTSEKNPLGRVLSVYEKNRDLDAETLELKLNEVVLRESSQLEKFLWLVKTVSVVAPLLGLLGTVTGMIQTFQAITMFGAGDPKMMAGGISEALVTTMLGLTIAIPARAAVRHAGEQHPSHHRRAGRAERRIDRDARRERARQLARWRLGEKPCLISRHSRSFGTSSRRGATSCS